MERFGNIIANAVKDIVSDIYITGGHPMVTRKNGNIQFHPTIKWSHQEVDALVQTLLNHRQIDALRLRKSLDYSTSRYNARLRINIVTTARGLSLAIRILPGHIPSIEELNLHPSLNEIARLESGLILNCGPTGVGKTTTVASIINEINYNRPAHVVMLEDPIEYRIQSKKAFIEQRELGIHMPSFAQGLIDVLRENPDVIVVGELREPETMRLTLNAAESGHLVIASMHASTPEEAIYRLFNAVPPESQNGIRFEIASTLSWLIVQQWIFMEAIGFRVPLLTILRGTPSVKNIIRENKLHQLESVMQTGKNEGMFTSDRYLSEYLEPRQTFNSPTRAFRPSAEKVDDIIYISPLMEDKPREIPMKKQLTKIHTDSIVSFADDSVNEEVEHILTIDENISLQEMLSKFKDIKR